MVNESIPVWANEQAAVHAYDPRWPFTAARESERLRELLGPWLVDGVEHVGSTSVPELAAKPIIDLMASVTDPGLVVEIGAHLLSADGWCFVPPELDQRPWRRFFVKPDPAARHRVAHLHVFQAGQPRWHEQLRFRDALRADEDLARRYAALKRDLATRCAHDREAYTSGKSEFVAAVLAAG